MTNDEVPNVERISKFEWRMANCACHIFRHSSLVIRHFTYQLAFLTPGIRPLSARLRKQIRQTPNLRYTALGRPQIRQRDSCRDENLGVLSAFAIFDLLAT